MKLDIIYLASFVFTIVLVVFVLAIGTSPSMLPTSYYANIEMLLDKEPRLKDFVSQIVEDGKITRKEYNELHLEYIRIKSK